MKSSYLYALMRNVLAALVAIPAAGFFCPTSEAQKEDQRFKARRFTFKIDPATPLKDLLPTPPKVSMLPPYLNEDLWEVPEVTLGDPLGKHPKAKDDPEEAMAHVLAKINYLNREDPDGFLKALAANRADLRGLPLIMAKDCRTEAKPAQLFAETAPMAQRLLRNIALADPEAASVPNERFTMELVRREFPKALADKEANAGKYRGRASKSDIDGANVAALMQIFAPAPALFRVGLAKYLATIPHVDATQALARLAVFAPEESVHKAALDGLKGRLTKDYTPILMQGFRYPLPAVSRRAADALVALKCQDVVADLVNFLEQPDPRAPQKQRVDGKDVTVVRELVRVNHHRNCLLCHPPANTPGVPRDVLTAPVQLSSAPLQFGYGSGGLSPDIFVRIDMTYLRQDFSMMRGEKGASPRDMQRFDFLVRTRVLTVEEAAKCEKILAKQGTPPNRAAAHDALRALTGRAPAEATAQAWRRLLKLPDANR